MSELTAIQIKMLNDAGVPLAIAAPMVESMGVILEVKNPVTGYPRFKVLVFDDQEVTLIGADTTGGATAIRLKEKGKSGELAMTGIEFAKQLIELLSPGTLSKP